MDWFRGSTILLPLSSLPSHALREYPFREASEALDSRALCRLVKGRPRQRFAAGFPTCKTSASSSDSGRSSDKDTVMQPAIQQVIKALAEDGRAGAIQIAEHAVSAYLADAPSEGDRVLSRDILIRDLASLRGIAPHLAGFIGRVEVYVASLAQPSLSRAA
ncbi:MULTISPECIES: hypothetical protein [unclassified Methylobacterium]|uniref:hypothetical protein n=1 Tax=unclassified Methylobacterium TaxID=2615210 RepID=UPI00226AF87B|nr:MULTISPECIES: hypothetical protein [unclassified Methylobacterium]